MKAYPWSYKYGNKEVVLFWVTEPDNDHFLTSKDGVLLSSSLLRQMSQSDQKHFEIQWDEIAEFDFNKFWVAINNLRENRASTSTTCNMLLDGWNFIEDIGRTFGLNKLMGKLKSKTMTKAYDKIFYGNNLPGVTPEGKSYNPLWEKEEIATIRKELKSVWNYYIEKGYIVK